MQPVHLVSQTGKLSLQRCVAYPRWQPRDGRHSANLQSPACYPRPGPLTPEECCLPRAWHGPHVSDPGNTRGRREPRRHSDLGGISRATKPRRGRREAVWQRHCRCRQGEHPPPPRRPRDRLQVRPVAAPGGGPLGNSPPKSRDLPPHPPRAPGAEPPASPLGHPEAGDRRAAPRRARAFSFQRGSLPQPHDPELGPCQPLAAPTARSPRPGSGRARRGPGSAEPAPTRQLRRSAPVRPLAPRGPRDPPRRQPAAARALPGPRPLRPHWACPGRAGRWEVDGRGAIGSGRRGRGRGGGGGGAKPHLHWACPGGRGGGPPRPSGRGPRGSGGEGELRPPRAAGRGLAAGKRTGRAGRGPHRATEPGSPVGAQAPARPAPHLGRPAFPERFPDSVLPAPSPRSQPSPFYFCRVARPREALGSLTTGEHSSRSHLGLFGWKFSVIASTKP